MAGTSTGAKKGWATRRGGGGRSGRIRLGQTARAIRGVVGMRLRAAVFAHPSEAKRLRGNIRGMIASGKTRSSAHLGNFLRIQRKMWGVRGY